MPFLARNRLADEVGNAQQIVGEHGAAHEYLKTHSATIEASLHATSAEENRDAAFDTGTEAFASF